jgi:hypothetical protein
VGEQGTYAAALVNASLYLYFPQRADAEEAAARLRDDGYDVTVRDGADDVNWLALASCDMAPENLDRVEQRMFALAGRRAPPPQRSYTPSSRALHVLPAGAGGQDAWNAPTGWKADWGGEWDDCWCFGEDAFGSQFALAGGEVVLADAETGRREPVAGSIGGWAERVLADYDYLCGYPLARDWQAQHGVLPPGKRLFPRTPVHARRRSDHPRA